MKNTKPEKEALAYQRKNFWKEAPRRTKESYGICRAIHKLSQSGKNKRETVAYT